MKVSIIIALAPNRIAPVLKYIEKIDYPKQNYEVIVEKGYNPSENRNKGIKKAKHEILLFLDDDCYIEQDLLIKAEKIFQEYNPDVLGGPQLTPKDDNYFAKTSGYVIASWFGSHNMSIRYKKGKLNTNANETHLTSAICFIKKEVFSKTEAFNSKLWPGEDTELFARLKKLNFKMIYHPDIYIYHKRRPNLKGFIKQFFNYGKVCAQKEKRKSNKVTTAFVMPSFVVIYTLIFIISLISGSIIGFNPVLNWIIYIFIIFGITYVSLILINSIYLSFKHKDMLALPLMPIIYVAEHGSYGLGMIYFLIKGKV